MKTKNYLPVLTYIIASLFMVSCGTNTNKQTIITVDDIVQNADAYVDDTIAVRGFCVSICSQGGDHITIMGEDSTSVIEVRANPELFTFDTKVMYTDVIVTGVLTENRVSQEFLNDWELRLDQSLEGENSNPEAVAQLKEQIKQIRAIIDVRIKSEGKDYWSQYKIASLNYEIEE